MWCAEQKTWNAPMTGANEDEWSEDCEWENVDPTGAEQIPADADDDNDREPQVDPLFDHHNWSRQGPRAFSTGMGAVT